MNYITHVKFCVSIGGFLRDCVLVFKGFPGGTEVKASACNVGGLGSIPGLGRYPGEGNGNPLQYSCLDNPMDRGALWATVHQLVAKSRTQLSDFTFTFIFTLHMWRNYPECSRETERCMQSIWEISCKTWKKSLRDLEDKHVQKSPNGYFKGKKCERMGERNNVKMHHSSEFSKLFKDKSSISGNWMNFK